MKLRARLAASTAAVLVPLIAGLVVWDAVSRRQAASDLLLHLTLDHLERDLPRCEADPAQWRADLGRRGPRPPAGPPPGLPGPPPPQTWVYDGSRTAARADAPAWPVGELAVGEGVVVPGRWWSSELWVAARTSGAACAYVLVKGGTTPGFVGAVLPRSQVWLVPALAVLGAVLIAVGPTVDRVRRLTTSVREATRRGYLAFELGDEGNDEIGELARAFAGAARVARARIATQQAQEQALREFLANTTHDVAIPLTVLQGHLAALRAQAGPELRERVVAAMREADYVGALLHNLGAAAKLEGDEQRLVRGRVDLGALAERVVARHQTLATEGGVSIAVAVPPSPVWIDADVTLVEQAVSNLVHNAVRYNAAGGHVAVVVEPDGPDRWTLRVVDDGPGVPADALARLVERGFQLDPARTRGGTGLGLDIVARVARAHAMALSLENAQPRGLEVSLSGATAGGPPAG